MNKLLPWLKVNMTQFMNIETLDLEAIPENSGCYIMISDNTDYIYPRGKSRVYYIGKAKNLRTRLKTHKRHCSKRVELVKHHDFGDKYYYPRYEYAAYHGCNVGLIITKSENIAKSMETILLIDFANYYGAKPVANGQSAWL